MAKNYTHHLWFTPGHERFFLIPADEELPPGDLVLRSFRRQELKVDPLMVVRFEVSKQAAKDWLNRRMDRFFQEKKAAVLDTLRWWRAFVAGEQLEARVQQPAAEAPAQKKPAPAAPPVATPEKEAGGEIEEMLDDMWRIAEGAEAPAEAEERAQTEAWDRAVQATYQKDKKDAPAEVENAADPLRELLAKLNSEESKRAHARHLDRLAHRVKKAAATAGNRLRGLATDLMAGVPAPVLDKPATEHPPTPPTPPPQPPPVVHPPQPVPDIASSGPLTGAAVVAPAVPDAGLMPIISEITAPYLPTITPGADVPLPGSPGRVEVVEPMPSPLRPPPALVPDSEELPPDVEPAPAPDPLSKPVVPEPRPRPAATLPATKQETPSASEPESQPGPEHLDQVFAEEELEPLAPRMTPLRPTQPRRPVMNRRRSILVFFSVVFFLALGLLTAWVVVKVLDIHNEGALAALILLPVLLYLVFSGRIAEFSLGVLGAKLREPVLANRGFTAALEASLLSKEARATRMEARSLDQLTQDIEVVVKHRLDKLPETVRRLKRIEEDRPPVLFLILGTQYDLEHLLAYIRDLSHLRRFKFVVITDEDFKVIGYLPYYALTKILDRDFPERSKAFLRLIYDRNAEALRQYPGVRTELLRPEDTNKRALQLMTEQQIESLLVVDGNRRLRGVVERDQLVGYLLLAAAE